MTRNSATVPIPPAELS